jgi:hypothetical protein
MQQMREAFPWDEAPRYVLRDRDATCCTAIALAGAAPSFRTMCVWLPPASTNDIPCVYTLGLQAGSSLS